MKFYKVYVAEIVGTAVLVLCGCGSAVLAGSHIGFAGVAAAFGLTLTAMIYAIGPTSGCHLNPAVTLGLTLAGKFDPRLAPGYMAAQVAGSVLAAVLLLFIANGTGSYDPVAAGFASNGYDVRSPGGYALSAAFVAEFVFTLLLVLTILGATDLKAPVGFAGIAIGLVLVVIHLVTIPVTNTSVNPARSIGPALFAGSEALAQLWLFIVAPMLGGAAAAALYALLRPVEPVIQMPLRQAHQALPTELAQRLDRATVDPRA